MRRLALLAMPLLALQACGGGSDQSTACAAVITFVEPIVLLDAVSVEGESTTLGRVQITDLQLNGTAVNLSLTEATNLVQTAQGAECTVPCGLGHTEGTYSFQLSAPGYVTRAVSVEARYAVFQGGCPASYNGGTHVSLAMRRL